MDPTLPSNPHLSRDRGVARAVWVGLIANVLLAGLKTAVGILGHSQALLAEGINSTTDVAYNAVVWIFTRLARKPPDEEHPYGHRQLETIAALAVGAFVITTAITVFWNAVNDAYDLMIGERQAEATSVAALTVAAFTVALKTALTLWTRRMGERTHSPVVNAMGRDHRNDILSALAATVGIALARLGYLWVDPLAGALVSLVILGTGIQILREASADLLGSRPDPDFVAFVRERVLAVPGVDHIDDLTLHHFGPYLMLNLTIGVDGDLKVAEGDAIATQVEQALFEQIEFLRGVHIHYHPTPDGEPHPRLHVDPLSAASGLPSQERP